MRRIIVRADSCTGCRTCEVICSMHHEKKVAPSASRVRVRSEYPWKEQPVLCHQCADPKCREACPVSAITAGCTVPSINEGKCTACWACVSACPFGAVWESRRGTPVVCDTCSGEYLCVQWCQPKALTLGGEKP